MQIQDYSIYEGMLVITAATPRPESAPSTHFVAALIHEDFAAKVRALVREHKQVGDSAVQFPAAKRLANYFPQHAGLPIFKLIQFASAGTPRDIDPESMLEIIRLRYAFIIELLPGAFLIDEVTAEGKERILERACQELFKANDIPTVFIPGDSGLAPDDKTMVDIVCEMGPASGKRLFDIPSPT